VIQSRVTRAALTAFAGGLHLMGLADRGSGSAYPMGCLCVCVCVCACVCVVSL